MVGTSATWLSSVMIERPQTRPTIAVTIGSAHRHGGAEREQQDDHGHRQADDLARVGLRLGDLLADVAADAHLRPASRAGSAASTMRWASSIVRSLGLALRLSAM